MRHARDIKRDAARIPPNIIQAQVAWATAGGHARAAASAACTPRAANSRVGYRQLRYVVKGDPWWCAPEPAPDFSPCSAEMRIEPIVEVVPAATATAELTGTGLASTPRATSATPTQTAAPTVASTVSPLNQAGARVKRDAPAGRRGYRRRYCLDRRLRQLSPD